MIKSENVEILKEGKPIGDHECRFVNSQLDYTTPEEITKFRRICQFCGRTEHVTRTNERLNFKDLYNKFHGQEGL